MFGEDGDDILRVLNGEYDNSYGGNGTDTLDHSASSYSGSTFNFQAGTITGAGINGASAVLSSIEIYQDGSGSNTIISDGSGAYYGNGGDDTMHAGLGTAETLNGGSGIDTLDTTAWGGDYVIDMNTGATNYPPELFTNFENLISGAGNDIITGTAGTNVISTGDGNDTIIDLQAMGSNDDDVDSGGNGTDTLVHDLNWVSTVTFDLTAGWSMFNGNRDQLISIENLTVGGSATVIGSAVANVLTVNGTGANVINGMAGNDTINAGGGNDTIDAGDGNDSVDAGDGDDTIVDTIAMFATNDDVFDGGAGIDTLVHDLSWVSSVTFDLTAGWSMYNGNRDQLISIENLTVGGAATVIGSAVANVLTVNGTGANVINGMAGDDTIIAGGGNDTIDGGSGADSILAGDGDDVINDTDGTTNDVYNGGAGIDRLDYSGINFVPGVVFDMINGYVGLNGGAPNDDLFSGIEILSASQGNDIVISNGDGEYYGNGGDDLMFAGLTFSSEIIDGGAGVDTLDTTSFSGTYTVDMVTGLTNYAGELFTNFENLITGNGADTVTGTAGANFISTNGGNDSIAAAGGNDTLEGGDGNDTLDGGTGADEMGGGDGDDLYLVDNAGDVIVGEVDNAAGGHDSVYASVSHAGHGARGPVP